MNKTRTISGRLLALAALLGLGGAGCLLSAEGELPDVEVTQHDVAIPAAPSISGGDVPIAVSFVQKPNRAGLKKNAFSQVRVLGVEVSAKSGVPDLSFLSSLSLSATSPEAQAEGLPPVPIGSFERAVQGPAGARLLLSTPTPPDVTELWKSSALIFTINAAGRMPNVTWTADVALRFEAILNY